MSDHTGKQFGNYRLLRLVDSGGFADVYLGEHVYLKTLNAVKVLQMQLFEVDQQQNFFNEARFIAHLKHPHIVQVQDFGVEKDTPFLVMSYAPHGNLRQRHPEGTRVPVSMVVSYVKQIASALQYAHDQKLIHRDIKPENMLVGSNGEILLSDFGIAIVARSSHSQSMQEVVGTVAYMAPEQIRGKPRPASDQYALAIIVYEWLSGICPFEGNTYVEVASNHLSAPVPPLLAKAPGIAPAVAEVITKALAKDYHQRFENVQAFADALELAYRFGVSPGSVTYNEEHAQESTEGRQQERPAERRNSRRAVAGVLVGAGILLAAGGGLSWLAFTPKKQNPSTRTGSTATTVPTRPTLAPSPAATVGTILYTYRGHSNSIDTIVWSPDGQRIASGSSDNTLQVWGALSGSHVVTRSNYSSFNREEGATWSPDGKYIASNGLDNNVHIWEAPMRREILSYRGSSGPIAWSPNGKYLAMGSGYGPVQVLDATTGAVIITYRGHMATGTLDMTNSVNFVAWSHDGKYLASCGDDGTVQVWNPLTGVRISNYTGHRDGTSYAAPGITALSSTTSFSVIGGAQRRGLHAYTQFSQPGRELSPIPYAVGSVAWSPDGKFVASASADQTVHISSALTGNHILTYRGHTHYVITTAWSPDGKRIASGGDDNVVLLWDATTGSTLFTYRQHTDYVFSVAWSPNGQCIASGGGDQTVQVWKAN